MKISNSTLLPSVPVIFAVGWLDYGRVIMYNKLCKLACQLYLTLPFKQWSEHGTTLDIVLFFESHLGF